VAFWEDMNVGYCMRALGVVPTVASDERGRERFHHRSPDDVARGAPGVWAPDSVSFHYVTSGEEMRRVHALVMRCAREGLGADGSQELAIS
jgi:hypothetical protein